MARKWLRHHRKRVALPTTNFCPQCTCEPVVTCITALSTVSKYVHARDYQFVVRPRTSKIVNMRVCVNLGTCMHESISSPYHAPFPLPVNVGSSSSSLLWPITFSSLFVIDVIDRKIKITTRSLDFYINLFWIVIHQIFFQIIKSNLLRNRCEKIIKKGDELWYIVHQLFKLTGQKNEQLNGRSETKSIDNVFKKLFYLRLKKKINKY